MRGIFFVNVPQRTKQPNRVAFFVRWRRHPLIKSGSARPSGAAESGSHSPLGDRQARLPGVECANLRAKREIPETWCNSIAIRGGVCYNKTRKAVGI